ncbi:MAG: hypothetical protein AAGH15_27480, partial [Myxococcota bacterium]
MRGAMLLLLAVATGACARSAASGEASDVERGDGGRDAATLDAGTFDAGTSDAGAFDGGVDAAGADAGPPETLGPCDDPSLWSRPASYAWEREIVPVLGSPSGLARARVGVPATSVCFRVVEAGPTTGWEVGATWREEARVGQTQTVGHLYFREGQTPLTIVARAFDTEGGLMEIRLSPWEVPRRRLAAGVEDFIGLGAPGAMAFELRTY